MRLQAFGAAGWMELEMSARWLAVVLFLSGLGLASWVAFKWFTEHALAQDKSPVAGVIIASILIYGAILLLRRPASGGR